MRHLSVLTVMALLAGTAFAGGISATDPPDIRLLPGAAAENVFDMNDFISGTSFSGDVIDANGMVSIPGTDAVGLTDFAVSVDGAEVTITRKVSSFMLEGAPDCDDNMILVDQAAGSNVFLNCLRAGVAVNSAVNLTGGPDPGTGGSPSDGSPAAGAAWIVTLGTVSGSSAVVAQGEGEASFGGLTASIDAEGMYTLVSDDSFDGAVAVTFVKKDGDDMDAATVVASAAVAAGESYAVNDMEAGTELLAPPTGVESFSFDGKLNVTVAAGAIAQLFFKPVAVSGSVNVSVAYSGSLGASIAVMDGNFLDLTYIFSVGPGEVDANTQRRLAVDFDSVSGSVIPVLQLAGGAEGGTVTFDDLQICAAAACPEKSVVLTKGFSTEPFAGDFSGGLDGAVQDINTQAGTIGYNAPSVVDGAVQLSATKSALSNITLSAILSGPAVAVISCDAKVVSSGGQGATAGLFQFVGGSYTEAGGQTNFGTFVASSSLGSDWSNVQAACPIQSSVLGGFTVTAQAAIGALEYADGDELTVAVDNINVSVIDTNPLFFDATLLGS